jgi:hypothetical protein
MCGVVSITAAGAAEEFHLTSRIATCAKTAEPKAKISLPDKPPHHTGIDGMNRSGQIKQYLVICISIKL